MHYTQQTQSSHTHRTTHGYYKLFIFVTWKTWKQVIHIMIKYMNLILLFGVNFVDMF